MEPSRALAAALEPVIGQVYFSPECHANYVGARLRRQPRRGQRRGAARRPGLLHEPRLADGPGARRARRRRVRRVQPGGRRAVGRATGGRCTDATTICARPRRRARSPSSCASSATRPTASTAPDELLARAVRAAAPGGPAAVRRCAARQPMPDTDLGAVWRLGDMLREFRGDSHTAAWIGAGLDATEIGLLSELYWGLPMRTLQPHTRLDRRAVRRRARAPASRVVWWTTRASRRTVAASAKQIELETDLQMAPVDRGASATTSTSCSPSSCRGARRSATARAIPASGPHDLADAVGRR